MCINNNFFWNGLTNAGYRFLWRESRDDVKEIKERIFIDQQRLANLVYDADNRDRDGYPVMHHRLAIETARTDIYQFSQNLEEIRNDHSPEATALDRASATRAVSSVARFIHSNLLYKYILLPLGLIAMGWVIHRRGGHLLTSNFQIMGTGAHSASSLIRNGLLSLFSSSGAWLGALTTAALITYDYFFERKKVAMPEQTKNLLVTSLIGCALTRCMPNHNQLGHLAGTVATIIMGYFLQYRGVPTSTAHTLIHNVRAAIREKEIQQIHAMQDSFTNLNKINTILSADALTRSTLTSNKDFKEIGVEKSIDYLTKKLVQHLYIGNGNGIERYFTKKELEIIVKTLAAKKDCDYIGLVHLLIQQKMSEVVSSVINFHTCTDFLFRACQTPVQGISPSYIGIKIFNKFSKLFFNDTTQNLLLDCRQCEIIPPDVIEELYKCLNQDRIVHISSQAFTTLWNYVIFPRIEEHLYQAIAKLSISLSLREKECIQVSHAVKLVTQLFFYTSIQEVAFNPIDYVSRSQFVNDADFQQATVNSMRFMEFFFFPTKWKYITQAMKITASWTLSSQELVIPLQQPSFFGIGSYFQNFTSTKSLISFSPHPSVKDSVLASYGMIDESKPHMQQWRSITESGNIQMLPTSHCANTTAWRKKLIAAAQHNIVISGNYCGQAAFDEILTLILHRMEENNHLKVVIISSPDFVKNNPIKGIRNKELIVALEERYPDRFSVVYSPNVWFIGGEDGYKKSTNHTKYFGIDWGRYYIMGGSAIKDNFNASGVDNIFTILSEEENAQMRQSQALLENLRERWMHPNLDIQTIQQFNQDCSIFFKRCIQMLRFSSHFSSTELTPLLDRMTVVAELIGEANRQNSVEFYIENANQLTLNFHNNQVAGVQDEGVLGILVPGNFRDMDFVFSDPNDGFSSGRQLFLEMLRMAYRWETLGEHHAKRNAISFFNPSDVADLPIFTGKPKQKPIETDSVTHRIMREPMPSSTSISTRSVDGFAAVSVGRLQALYQGPEQASGTNAFSAKALELIRTAERHIVFNHMYFCPTDEIIESLKEAVEQRGVQLEVITCGKTAGCPVGQAVFGPYNQWNWVKLANAIAPEHRKNIRVFLFAQRKKGLHKKVIVVDGQNVLAGSSNFGYKSLVTSSDHEVNFIARSESLAQETLAICEEDKRLSEEVADLTHISSANSLLAMIYYSTRSLAN